MAGYQPSSFVMLEMAISTSFLVNEVDVSMQFKYTTTLRRVQVTPKASTDILRYLYSSAPVIKVFSHRVREESD